MKKALILGPGGLRGSFTAGASAELCKILGPDHFDAIYSTSVGVFAAAFFVANQPDTIENTWRNLVDGRKLVNPFNPFRGRTILDLDYLIDIFQKEESLLDLKAVFGSRTKLIYVVTDHASGEALYLQPTPENIFQLMKASCAVPLVSKPVLVDGSLYLDGAVSDALPVATARADGFDKLVVITNNPEGTKVSGLSKFAASFVPPHMRNLLMRSSEDRAKWGGPKKENEEICVIRPAFDLPLRHKLDTDKKRLSDTVDMGIEVVRSMRDILVNTA